MKVKITLLVIIHNIEFQYDQDEFFRVLIAGEDFFPSVYAGTCEIEETLNNLFDKYLNVQYGWKEVVIEDVRKTSINECEILYSIKIPDIKNAQKTGVFSPYKNDMEIDDFYGRVLKRRRTVF